VRSHEGCGHPNHDHDHDCHHDHDHDHDCHHDHDGERDRARSSNRNRSTDAGPSFQAYHGHGIAFRYPSPWTLTEDASVEQTTITVQSPETSFWTLTLFEDRPEPQHVLTTVQTAFRDEYPDLDVYESVASALGFPAVACELEFTCLDLVTAAFAVCFQAVDQTVLLMFQGEDRELIETRPVMEEMTRSFSFGDRPISSALSVDS
jgi:hypothetical protein